MTSEYIGGGGGDSVHNEEESKSSSNRMQDLTINDDDNTGNGTGTGTNTGSTDITTDEEQEMNLEERMNWLRERGVQVETAEERKRKQIVAAMNQAESLQQQQNISTTTGSSDSEVLYVMIPTDTSKPLQQLSFHPNTNTISSSSSSGGGGGDDALAIHLQSAFTLKDDETIDIELLRQQSQTTSLLSTGGGTTDVLPTVSDTTLRKVSAQTSVETFTLVQGTSTNQHISIVLYLDEIGMMKRLPLNTRATDYCQRAGYNPPPIFYGTIYIGRLQRQQQQQKIRNLSFVLGPDTSYDALWLQSAMSTNLQHQLAMNQLTGRSNQQQQVGAAGSDGKIQKEDGYHWTQTEQELEVVVLLPIDAISKHIMVKFQPLLLTVLYDKTPKLSIPLFERIDVDACTWTLEGTTTTTTNASIDDESNDLRNNNKRLIMTMEKLEEAYWPRIRD